ncbi:serine/threonine-protein kinase [Umezawaea endophytica]|uniref:non-specific serine/threonine protein kinase n=1 Tax=Umezawaea endophytica TaxID=1654476 RepID=A0A9X2VQX2_9PSEU|nr:serine/threonine-protein kinase [Umezawaea endophytica]MCS7481218.1 serine/threonine protein kinase [Umezawaea endophytica]
MSTAQPIVSDRFHLEGLLGVGGFASVWSARDTVLDTRVAVKVLADNWTAVPDVRERFLDEVRVLRRVSSPHVVRVFDLSLTASGRPYFAMELADRGTLEERTAGTPLPPVEALDLLRQVCAGVTALHGAGVVHRDLKPSNVLLRWDADAGRESAVVADLGLSKSLADGSGFTVAVGSSGYTAPEQRGPGSIVERRTDVYALGALAYRLLTGVNPPEAGPSARSLRALPGGAGAVVGRAMAPLPADRWGTADAFCAALRHAVGDRRAARRVRAAAAVAVPIALVFAAAGADGPPGSAETTVAAPDGLAVTVPTTWARQVRAGGWTPGADDGRQPALEAAPDLGRFHDLAADAPGVFIGRVGPQDASTWSGERAHAGCGAVVESRFESPRWSGVVRRWERCPGRSVDEVVLTDVADERLVLVVQVRGGGSGVAVRRLLDTVRAR